jgi:hypothetical protein
MRHITAKLASCADLFALALCGICLEPQAALAQIYLAPNQQFPQGSRVSIDLGNVRCNSDGGALPNLSVSAGAYPDQWGNRISVAQSSGNASIGNQSSLLAMVSLNIPLAGSNPRFSCQALLKDAVIRTRMENLRQLVDEDVITESQYKQALLSLYGPLSARELAVPPSPMRGATLTLE